MGFQFGFKDIIDILIVAIIFYETYKLLKRTGAVNVFWGIFAFIIIWVVLAYVKLQLTSAIFNQISSVGAIALIVIFQDEIRTFFSHLGSHFSFSWENIHRKLHVDKQKEADERNVLQIVLACKRMAKQKIGALIVITREQELRGYAETGEKLNAIISARLIENIFFKNSPLHDGALIISKSRLQAAACILPISKSTNIPEHYGLRHRAALGIAEKTDSLAIVISEETGNISIAINDSIKTIKIEELEKILSKEMHNK